ncbi:hypothetical protein [Lacinutrix cladophorae]
MILILVMFLPAAIFAIYGKEAEKGSAKQKQYYQLAIVCLVTSFVIYSVVVLTNL